MSALFRFSAVGASASDCVLTPKFLKFYDEATREAASPDQRWALWKRDYDFAAVPPTPAGQTMARQMLDRAWPRYPDALDQISPMFVGSQSFLRLHNH